MIFHGDFCWQDIGNLCYAFIGFAGLAPLAWGRFRRWLKERRA